jgi:energy-coupling factor transport system substrate-specific component
MSMNNKTVNFREAIMTVVVAIIFGALYMVWSAGIYPIVDPLFVAGGDLVYGFWFIAAIVAAYIVQKPGIAFFAEMAAASGELILGSPYGVTVLISGAVQGLFAEMIFASFGYRNFKLPVLLLAGTFSGIGSILVDSYFYGFLKELNTNILTLKIVIRLFSGAILAGLLGKIIVDALAKTGVLNNYALIRKQRSQNFGDQKHSV